MMRLFHLKNLFVILVGLLTTALFFRTQLYTQGAFIFGDKFDGLIVVSIMQHWYNFFHGLVEWNVVNYLYPYPNTLGYNDGYFLYGVIYTVLRFFHVTMFMAAEGVNVVIRMIGFYAFFYLCYKQLQLNFYACLLMAVIFSLSTSAYQQASHVQLLSVSFAPLLTILIIHYLQQLLILKNTGKAIFWGSLAGVFYASWLISAYYMAWFYTFFACLLSVFLLLAQLKCKRFTLHKPAFSAIFFPALITLIALIPFLFVYLSSAMQTGMHGYKAAYYWVPRFSNILNVSAFNLLWGKLIANLHFRPEGEFWVGFPPIFLGLVILAIVKNFRSKEIEVVSFYRPLVYAIVISFLLSIMLSKHSLWRFVWAFFPGGRGLRVVCRYWIFLVFPLCVLLAHYLSRCTWTLKWKPWYAGLIVFLILEQISTLPTPQMQTKVEQAFLDSVAPIPRECQSFFVLGSRYEDPKHEFPPYRNNVDAMLIAEMVRVRTINGFTTFMPADWNFEYEPEATYQSRVEAYATKHGLKSTLCAFDIESRQWKTQPFKA